MNIYLASLLFSNADCLSAASQCGLFWCGLFLVGMSCEEVSCVALLYFLYYIIYCPAISFLPVSTSFLAYLSLVSWKLNQIAVCGKNKHEIK